MFERFTDRARRVVVLSQEEARRLNHNYIGTEHLLLGLLQEADGVAAGVLISLGVSLDEARALVEEIIGRGTETPTGHVPFTPRAKKVLELSLREALQLEHNYIGTEHLLLGLLREGDGVAAQVLTRLGAKLDQLRRAVTKALAGAPARRPPDPKPADVVIGSLEVENRQLRAEVDRLRHLLLAVGVGEGDAPPDTGQGDAPPDTGQGDAPPDTGQGDAPPDTGEGDAPPDTGEGHLSAGTGQGDEPAVADEPPGED